MTSPESPVEKLFSYGTLRDEKVQRAVFGRNLHGTTDAIAGYRLTAIKIDDPKAIAISGTNAHQILERTEHSGDQIEGVLFHITPRELQLADDYEDASYKRVQVRLHSGVSAWVYVAA